jgi:hypothetical protein
MIKVLQTTLQLQYLDLVLILIIIHIKYTILTTGAHHLIFIHLDGLKVSMMLLIVMVLSEEQMVGDTENIKVFLLLNIILQILLNN